MSWFHVSLTGAVGNAGCFTGQFVQHSSHLQLVPGARCEPREGVAVLLLHGLRVTVAPEGRADSHSVAELFRIGRVRPGERDVAFVKGDHLDVRGWRQCWTKPHAECQRKRVRVLKQKASKQHSIHWKAGKGANSHVYAEASAGWLAKPPVTMETLKVYRAPFSSLLNFTLESNSPLRTSTWWPSSCSATVKEESAASRGLHVAERESESVARLRFDTCSGTVQESHSSEAQLIQEVVSDAAGNDRHAVTGFADDGLSISQGVTGQGRHTEVDLGAHGQAGHPRLFCRHCLLKQHAEREKVLASSCGASAEQRFFQWLWKWQNYETVFLLSLRKQCTPAAKASC